MVINIDHLSKNYQVFKKDPGIMGSFKAVFTRKYETVKAVKDISFSIEEGEIVGFIGPNGAGKTTTLKMLSGLLYPTGGKVSVLGFTPFERKPQFLKQISLVMGQKNQLWWDLPAMETFLLNKEIYDISDKKFKEVIGDLTELLDVEKQLHIPVRNLSLGQRMKMELIAALIHSPKMLFLDEPTIGLDIFMQKKIREFLKEYNRKYKASIILTSHYMGDVEALCKRIIIINYGSILFDGLLTDMVKKFAPYKQIRVILKNHVSRKRLQEFGEMREVNYPVVYYTIKQMEAQKTAGRILRDLPVEDLVIEEPEIEDVIRDVYERAKK